MTLVGLSILYFGRSITLTAESEIKIMSSFEGHSQIVRVLSPGQSVQVISCIDTKSDFIPKVTVEGDLEGYITSGLFSLSRHKYIRVLSGPIVFFSC